MSKVYNSRCTNSHSRECYVTRRASYTDITDVEKCEFDCNCSTSFTLQSAHTLCECLGITVVTVLLLLVDLPNKMFLTTFKCHRLLLKDFGLQCGGT